MQRVRSFGWVILMAVVMLVFIGFGSMDSFMGVGMMGFWGWFPLIFFVGMIYFMMSRGSVGCMGHKHHQEETPLSILKTRYAKGEISKKDFERMKKELE